MMLINKKQFPYEASVESLNSLGIELKTQRLKFAMFSW